MTAHFKLEDLKVKRQRGAKWVYRDCPSSERYKNNLSANYNKAHH